MCSAHQSSGKDTWISYLIQEKKMESYFTLIVPNMFLFPWELLLRILLQGRQADAKLHTFICTTFLMRIKVIQLQLIWWQTTKQVLNRTRQDSMVNKEQS